MYHEGMETSAGATGNESSGMQTAKTYRYGRESE